MEVEELPSKAQYQQPLKIIGFIINPIAGMGGAVGLKGTDGEAALNKAKKLGATPIASKRARAFLNELEPYKKYIRMIVGSGNMGENEVQSLGFDCTVIGTKKEQTTAEDTRTAAKEIMKESATLLVFCGGDGTARNVLDVVDRNLPVLGVPTGVKMHSAVFAVEPRAAARIVVEFLSGDLPIREAEVMDVDEKAFRLGRVSAELYGYVLIPYEPRLIQASKLASPMTESEMRNQPAIAIYVIETMKPDVIYILGPGTTTRTIGDLMDEKKTLLGVDLICNKKIIARDVNENQILENIKGKNAQIIVTPIGGQGFIFGRGNQQISAQVIRQVGWNNTTVLATENKLRTLKTLRVDTGDQELDETIRGQVVKVITNYKTEQAVRIEK